MSLETMGNLLLGIVMVSGGLFVIVAVIFSLLRRENKETKNEK